MQGLGEPSVSRRGVFLSRNSIDENFKFCDGPGPSESQWSPKERNMQTKVTTNLGNLIWLLVSEPGFFKVLGELGRKLKHILELRPGSNII